MDLKPPEFDASPTSIEPQKFIDRYEKILTTLGLKETRGVEFSTFLFSGFAESWWISIQRGRQAGLPPITWSEFLALFKDRFIPLSKQDVSSIQRTGNSSYQQIQRTGNSSYQSGYHPRCSNCGRNHSGRCFRANGTCFTCGEKGHIAKYYPKGDSGASRATTQLQGTTTAT
ncbi:uncharacterized protein LOC132644446 [Lycium barbarum]|uniref:uncharacterized protein LOC132644446 n=1 Tax=Lycium barbarum TaxID=112863 RepID=UPI00293E1476|nr:uncharacterized protein LOC132644446 [Lycium barbarum]